MAQTTPLLLINQVCSKYWSVAVKLWNSNKKTMCFKSVLMAELQRNWQV